MHSVYIHAIFCQLFSVKDNKIPRGRQKERPEAPRKSCPMVIYWEENEILWGI